MNRILLPVLLILLLAFNTQIFSAENTSILGKWKTFNDQGEHDGVVQIYKQNGKFFGRIIELPRPEDKDSICDDCKGEDKDKPILGLTILKNLKEEDGEYTGGTILDPYTGKVYSCKIKLIENGQKLELRGFLWLSVIGNSKYWSRVDE